IAAQIAKELRTQYTVSYYPSNEKSDGTFRTLRVEVASNNKRKLMARTRQGYYAPTEQGTVRERERVQSKRKIK
ncbi:MAG TPA: hypothetical protein VJ302_14490, partial [Blastocatellia bacterium]|nr:hypothetical protein [Blastocatellia bacterium]